MENGSGTAEDEVNGALDVTTVVVMSASVIEKSVVGAVKCTVVERGHVCPHERRHRLVLRREGHPCWCIVLCPCGKKNVLTNQQSISKDSFSGNNNNNPATNHVVLKIYIILSLVKVN